MASNSMLEIPPELTIRILLELHFTDIFSCMRTCRTILEVAKSSVQLNYHIQLQRVGLQDNPRCRLPISERLEVLKEQKRCWASFTWKTTSTTDIPKNSCYLFRLGSSTLVMGIDENLKPQNFRVLRVARFSSEKDGPMLWKDFVLGVDIRAVAAAIEHDLIAFLVTVPSSANSALSDHPVYLFRYSTQDWHDASEKTILPIYYSTSGRIPWCRMEIYGDNLVVVSNKPSDLDIRNHSMLIYDWRTGRNKTPNLITLELTAYLAFIEEDVIAHANLIKSSIDLYHVFSSEAFSLGSQTKVRLVRRLLFPNTTLSWFLLPIEDPQPNSTGITLCPEFLSDTKPFANDPVHDIFSFLLTFWNEISSETKVFDFFTHRKALLDLVPPERMASNNTDILPWKKWRPPVTRWFIGKDYYELSVPFGQRFTGVRRCYLAGHGRPGQFKLKLEIFNFNSWTAKMAHQGLLKELVATGVDLNDHSNRLLAEDGKEVEENLFSGEGVFAPSFVCRLPYTRTVKDFAWPHGLNEGLLNGKMLLLRT